MTITKTDVSQIWEEVKANHAKLDACPMHEFDAVPKPLHTLLKDYFCKHCGGKIDSIAHTWYQRGQVRYRRSGV